MKPKHPVALLVGASSPSGWLQLGDTLTDPNPLWRPTGRV
jgi:hypothetical protein